MLTFPFKFIKIAKNVIDQHSLFIKPHEACGRSLVFNFVCFWSLVGETFSSVGSYPVHILCGTGKLWIIIIANIY